MIENNSETEKLNTKSWINHIVATIVVAIVFLILIVSGAKSSDFFGVVFSIAFYVGILLFFSASVRAKIRKESGALYGVLILAFLLGGVIFGESDSGKDNEVELTSVPEQKVEHQEPVITTHNEPQRQKIDETQIESLLEEAYNAYDKKQYVQAFKMYLPLAEQGNAKAQKNIGGMYLDGVGVEKNYEQALTWLTKAAEQGIPSAWHDLGVMYEKGMGVAQSNAEAVMWYRKAAEQGVAPSQVNLGIAYEDGLGVNKDYEQAAYWYRKAAEQNRALGLNNLGILYLRGQGVEENRILAQMLFILASVSGSVEGEKNTRLLESQLSYQELNAAKRLSESWVVGTPLPTKAEKARYDLE